MAELAERIFPIRIEVDPEAEKFRTNQKPSDTQESFSYKRLDKHLCHSKVQNNPSTSIQSFGALVAIQVKDETHYTVFAASNNTGKILGYDPEELFTLDFFGTIISEQNRKAFGSCLWACVQAEPGEHHEISADVSRVSLASALEGSLGQPRILANRAFHYNCGIVYYSNTNL